eukprot:g8687.t1
MPNCPSDRRACSRCCYELVVLQEGSRLVNFVMGIIFGTINTECHQYKVLKKFEGFEVREYSPVVTASVQMSDNDRNSAFNILARYIGVFNAAENVKSEAIAMTAPVYKQNEGKSEKIAMTAPVHITPETMSFVLPAKYKSLEEVPKPTNQRVTLALLPAHLAAVRTYNGSHEMKIHEANAKALHAQVSKAFASEEFALAPNALETWRFAGYNPPFTIPYFRTNEILLDVVRKGTEGAASHTDLSAADFPGAADVSAADFQTDKHAENNADL